MSTIPKETAYDAIIAPLMTQIITACREHRINMFATFALDQCEDDDRILRCTTAMSANDPDDKEGADMVAALRKVVRPTSLFAAVTMVMGR